MTAHPLVFRRYGGSLQVEIGDFEELLAAIELHDALWVASASPVRGLSCDPAFLAALDRDGNGRIVSDDLREAVRWTAAQLDDRTNVDEASYTLVLAHLSKEAAPLERAARTILDATGAAKKKSITLAEIRASASALRERGINGDGIVAPDTIEDPEVAEAARAILGVLPGKTNLAGKKGVDADTLAELRKKRGEGLARLEAESAVMIWGADSVARARATAAAREALDEHFVQCRLVAGQPDAGSELRLTADRVHGALGDREALARAARALPIAPPHAEGVLRFSELRRGPAFEAVDAFRREVAIPALGARAEESLDEASWRELRGAAGAILAWVEQGEKDAVIGLGAKLRELDDAKLDAIAAAIEADLAQKETLEAIAALEKLVLHQRWLLRFANNFVSMPELFDQRRPALFERGTLTLAGRYFTLAVEVFDRAAHAALADGSNTFVAYVKVEPAGKPAFEVAVPVTAGTSAGIATGKRGVFRDPEGNEMDATIVHVVRQPVSLWEAAIAPFARVGRYVSGKLEELGKSGDTAMETSIASAETGVRAERARHEASAGAPAPAASPDRPATPAAAPAAPSTGALGGVIASGGLALAAVGSSLAFMVSQLQGVSLFDVVRATIAIAAIVMIPSAFLGWLKLRRRDLAILLEGSGWALNDRLMLTRRLGRFFTRRPPRPAGSRIDRSDLVPEVEGDSEEARRRGGRITLAVVVGVLLLAWWTHALWWPHVRTLLPLPSEPAASTDDGAAAD